MQPGVPAKVTVSLTLSNSSESARIDKLFAEMRTDLVILRQVVKISVLVSRENTANYTAEYTSPEGVLWMASRRWASIVKTRNRIITHGHRGRRWLRNKTVVSMKTAVSKCSFLFALSDRRCHGCRTRLSECGCKTSSHSMMAMGLY